MHNSTRLVGYVHGKNGPLGGAKIICNGKETITLFDGSFTLGDITPGTCVVAVSLKGFNSQTRRIEVSEVTTTYLNFQLQESEGTAKIFGFVYDCQTKRPVSSDGTIILILPVSNLYMHIDKDGYFEFSRLAGDKYEILVSIPGYEQAKAVISIEDGEQLRCDFHCKPIRIETPPWG